MQKTHHSSTWVKTNLPVMPIFLMRPTRLVLQGVCAFLLWVLRTLQDFEDPDCCSSSACSVSRLWKENLELPPRHASLYTYQATLVTGQRTCIFSWLYNVSKPSLLTRHSPFLPLCWQPNSWSPAADVAVMDTQDPRRINIGRRLENLLTSLFFVSEIQPRKAAKTGSSAKSTPTNLQT